MSAVQLAEPVVEGRNGGKLLSGGMTKEQRLFSKANIARAKTFVEIAKQTEPEPIDPEPEIDELAEIGEESQDSPPIPLPEASGAVAYLISQTIQLREIGKSLWDGVCPLCRALGHSLVVEPCTWRCQSFTCAAGVVMIDPPVYRLIGGGVEDWEALKADYPLLFESNLGFERHLLDAQSCDDAL